MPAPEAREIARVGQRYAVAITPAMAELIDRTNPDDPIARQFVPDIRELESHPGESADPIGDLVKSPVAGLVHRHPDRVLLKLTGLCPVYCRFCFRREMVGPRNSEALTPAQVQAALAHIRDDARIWEVIMTGGDPLILSPRRISAVTAALAAIAHVKVLRWHSRVPVVEPERITDTLIGALRADGKRVVIGLHANHPRELTAATRDALARLARAGIMLVSQSVLLAGVNDDAGTLEALMRAFVEAGVKPYYLHHLDRAPGTGHFHVPLARGQAIMAELRRRLSGLALPAYVLDIPGAHGKVPIEPGRAVDLGEGRLWHITDVRGTTHLYEDGG